MTVFRRCGLLLAAFVLACSADSVVGPGGRFDHALARSVCGPADGAALAIYLSTDPIPSEEPSGEFVRVFIDGPSEQLLGQRLPIGSPSIVSATYNWGGAKFELARSGYVTLNSGSEGNGLEGSVDLQFPSAGRVHGAFHAEWLPNVTGCA